jgi:hypothetical protein
MMTPDTHFYLQQGIISMAETFSFSHNIAGNKPLAIGLLVRQY